MIFWALPDVTDEKPFEDAKMHSLRTLLTEQLHDLNVLCTVVEYLKGFKKQGLDPTDAQKYYAKITAIELNQQQRFAQMDAYILDDVLALKKDPAANKTVMESSKEVRKLEAGLRTLKLFATDMIKMLEPNSTLLNRVDERLYYFKHRSAVLEVEMKVLQEQLASL